MSGTFDDLLPRSAPGGAGSNPFADLIPSNMDRRTGAPASVRTSVGAATTQQDRLATLRRTYPDAQPFGPENFSFTDPRTGRRTLYNPKGLDWGDAASLLPETGELVGGAVGGALALGSVPFTGPGGVLATPAGIGLGAAAGREIATMAPRLLGSTVDTRGPVERVADAATTAGANAAGLPVSNAISAGARALWGPVGRAFGRGTGQAVVDDFTQLGVPLSLGAVSGNRTTQVMERGVAALPGGAQPMAASVERQAEGLGRAVARQADNLAGGAPGTLEQAGGRLRAGAAGAVERFEARQSQLYDDAFNRVGADRAVELPTVRDLGREIAGQLAQAPASRARTLQPVLDRLGQIAADAGDAGVRFDALRAIRTDLGRVIGQPPNAANAPSSDTLVYLRRLYGALTEDMGAAARAAGPEAAQALGTADRYTRFNRNLNMPALEKVLGTNTDEAAYRALFPANGKPDGQTAARLMRNLTPDERQAVAATVLDRMGNPTPGAAAGETFSPSTFLTNWNKLQANGPGARQAIFGNNPELASGLDRLVRVAGTLRDVNRGMNFSNTAPVALGGAAIMQAGSDVMEGDMGGLAKTIGLTLVAPRIAARVLTDPRFVRWAVAAAPAAGRNGELPEGAVRALGRVALASPTIRDEVEALQAALRSAPAPARAPAVPAR